MDILNRRSLLAGLFLLPVLPAISGCATLPGTAETGTRFGKIETSVTGQGRPPIVLLHGHGVDMTTWSGILPDLSTLSQVLAFNRPGYGESEWRNVPRDAYAISDEVFAVLASVGIDGPVVLAGHSLGGVYAQACARRFPDRVAGMVLIDTAVPGQGALLRRMLPDLVAKAELAMAFQAAGVRREFEDSDLADAQMQAMPLYRNGKVVVLAASNPAPSVPQTYIAARTAAMRKLAQDYGADFKIVDSGHFVHQDRPDVVLETLRSVIKAHAF